MATPALKYTNFLLKNAVEKLQLDSLHAKWFLEEMTGHQRWSDQVAVTFDDREFPGHKRPHYFKIVCVKHRSPDDSWIFAGGWRLHPNVSLSQMENLSTEMSIKAWINRLPYAGAKGGGQMDPRDFSTDEMKSIINKTVEKLVECGIIGPFKYRLAPDVNSTADMMQWICDHYGYILRTHGRHEVPFEGVVTGKPGPKGISFRKQATGVGMHCALETFRRGLNLGLPRDPRAVVNGCGNVGLHFIKSASDYGIKIVGVRDLYSALYKRDGFPVEDLVRYVEHHSKRSIEGFEATCPGVEVITEREKFFALDADIFVPAALEGDITVREAEAMRCTVILEGANSPTTSDGDEVLNRRNITVIPDILANSGGVIVSYFEHMYNIGWTEKYPDAPVPERDDEHVHAALQHYIADNGRALIDVSKQYGVPTRLAGYILALGRVFPKFAVKRRMNIGNWQFEY